MSRYNALKHGLLNKELLLTSEDEVAFSEFSAALCAELCPVGQFEMMLVERIISCHWRLRRAIFVEKNTMDWHEEDTDIPVLPPQSTEQKRRWRIKNMLGNDGIENILRYETAIERSLYRALHEFERMQARKKGTHIPAPAILDVSIDGSFRNNDV